MVLMLNMDTAMNFSILTELQMYTLLVTLMLKAELVGMSDDFLKMQVAKK